MRRRCGSAWRRAAQALGSWQNGWSPCCGPVPAPTAATLVGWPPRRRRWLGSTPGRHGTCTRPGRPPTGPTTSSPTGWSTSISRGRPPILRWGRSGMNGRSRSIWAWPPIRWSWRPGAGRSWTGWSARCAGRPPPAGPGELLDWLGQLDQQVARRLSEEFDIPPQLRVLRHELAPPGSAAGAYYLPPTEDGARPGVVVWTMPAGRVPLWRWQTFSHHEGMPGHHLELGGVRFLAAPLSRFQTGLGEISGYSEGWGLYAERFMDELGAFDRPATRLGFLISQAFRTVRVVVDTGLHLGLRVPATLADPTAGQIITPEVAVELLVRHGWQTQEFARSEVLRYLGCPAQAVAYKIGEREWLRVRAQARHRIPGLTNRQFHAAALRLGPLPLRLLGPEVLTALDDVTQDPLPPQPRSTQAPSEDRPCC